MKEYYSILHYLKEATVDAQYPCQSYFKDGVYDKPELLFETNHKSFDGIESVEVLLKADADFNSSDLTFSFSEYVDGYVPILTLTADDELCEAGLEHKIVFELTKKQQMATIDRILTNIKSVGLHHELENINFEIYDIVFKTESPKYTLEELEECLKDGVYYVASTLQMKEEDIPEELIKFKYTAAAGYAWMGAWEFDARIMNDEQKNAMSYGKWLFSRVDNAIDNYKKANDLVDESVIADNIIGHSILKW